MLIRKGNEGLLNNNPHLGKVLVWDKKRGKYKDLLRLLNLIRNSNYDQVINLQRFGATGILTALSGATHKVGFEKNPFAYFFTKKISHHIDAEGGPHEIARNQRLISHLAGEQPMLPKLYPGERELEAIKPYLSQTPFICIAPSSVWYTKQYPEERWATLISALPADLKVFLLGGPEDARMCERLTTFATKGQVMNLAGKLSLLASAALMREASMNLVNDSAPMHLASAMNAPVGAIFCSTVPGFGFGPLSEQSHIFEVDYDLECRPCGLHGYRACPKGHFKCAMDIDQAPILEIVRQAIIDSTD